MSRTSQREPQARPHSLRMWLTSLACLLLLLVGSTAQAAHVHGALLPHADHELSASLGGDHPLAPELCPLCVAMHSALPASARPPLAPVLQRLGASVPPTSAGTRQSWAFDLFSRPPPVLL